MHEFEYFAPTSLREAIELRSKYGGDARYVAGGTNLLYMMKRGVRRPRVLVNLERISDLDRIEYTQGDGLQVGALARISALERSETVNEKYGVLAQSASKIATPEIRNVGTVGGNLCQENWCWYLMEGFDCWMNGGSYCYAPGGDNRYHHSVMGGYFCMAIHPSDLATGFTALDATARIVSGSGERESTCDALFPGFTKVEGRLQQNTLRQDELISEVHVPEAWAGARGVFVKSAPRSSIDFAISSVAVVVKTEEDQEERCKDARIVFGGIATKPYRAESAEEALKGAPLDQPHIDKAAGRAFGKTVALSGNSYRVGLSRALLKRALNQLSAPYSRGGSELA